MFMTLTDYNDRNNTPLSNENIWESIRKAMEEESISYANNVNAHTFSHTSNTQIDNENAIFKSDKLDKLDNLVDMWKDLTINNVKYYESDTATASDTQGDPTHYPKIVIHTSNGNEKVTDTINRDFEQKLLSNRNLHVVVPTMNPRIDQIIAPIVVAP